MKKLISLLLALVMVLSLSTVAFADATEPVDMSTVTVKKTYRLIGAGSSPKETFTLEQVGDGRVIDGDAKTAPHLGTITGAEFDVGAANANKPAEGNIVISLPDANAFSAVGIYEYTLKEVAGSNAGVGYYGSNITLVVTVANDGDNTKRVAAVHVEAKGENGFDSSTKVGSFENTYSANTLSVSKTVDGNMADKGKYFIFKVKLEGDTTKTYQNVTVSETSNYANPTTIAVDGTEYTFYLRHNETIEFGNIPKGVTYTVEESDYTADGYTTKIGNDVKREATGTIGENASSVAFTNIKGGTIDTGVMLDSLPYMLILAVVAVTGTALIFKKRTNI